MFGCVLEMRMCLLIWILSFWCSVSSKGLQLSSLPTTLLEGQNLTLICKATFSINSDSITWINGNIDVFYTQNSDKHIILPDNYRLQGRWYVNIDSSYHNLTITLKTGDNFGPWMCRSNTKGVSSKKLNISIDLTSSTRTPSSSKQFKSTTILVAEHTNKGTSHKVDVISGSTINVTPGDTVDVTFGHTVNVFSGYTVNTTHDTVYIAVGSSLGVAVTATVIIVVVCCIHRKKRSDKDSDNVIEENVLYMSSSFEDSGRQISSDGQLYASINKPSYTCTEGVNLHDLYAKPNKTNHTSTEGVNLEEVYSKAKKPKPGDIKGVTIDDLYAKPNKTEDISNVGNFDELYAKPNKTRKQAA